MKLMHDARFKEGLIGGGTTRDTTRGGQGETDLAAAKKTIANLKAKLAEVAAQRDELQRQLCDTRQLLHAIDHQHQQQHQQYQYHQQNILHIGVSGGGGGSRPTSAASMMGVNLQQQQQAELSALREQAAHDRSTIQRLTQERDAARADANMRQNANSRGFYGASATATSPPPANQELVQELQRLREKAMDDASRLDAVARERDMLSLQLNIARDEQQQGGLDASSVLQLQHAINDKTTQLTIINNKFAAAQQQVDALKSEVDRLINELRAMHDTNANVKREMFQLENEKSNLTIKCERLEEVEMMLKHKTEELMRTEQELLRMVDRMQSCSRDTEMQVRRDCTERFVELERMRDDADHQRREKERDCFALQQDLNDAKRSLQSAKEDVAIMKGEMEKLREEKRELADRAVLLGGRSLEVDDDVHKAVAMVSMKKRADKNAEVAVLDMWEGLEWNEGWEAAKMREALAACALDIELAQTQCTQMRQRVEEKDKLLGDIGQERDTLLDENIELRRRISGVQTALAKRAMRAAAEEDGGSLTFVVERVKCDPEITICDDGSQFAPMLFFSLDGLDGYETVLSESFYSVDAVLNAEFKYSGLNVTETTLCALSNAVFTLQLHQSFGTCSNIVAVATISGSQVLRSREEGVAYICADLADGEGATIGKVDVKIFVAELFLPLILRRPLMSVLSAEATRAALISLRGILALKVAVFRATDLRSSAAAPFPYVFYTSPSTAQGVSFICDTVVQPNSKVATSNPQFDGTLPTEHRTVVDREFIHFVHEGAITFVVFDHNAEDVKDNLGIAVVPLRKLLDSPTATIVSTEKLHPQGSLEIGLSWVLS